MDFYCCFLILSSLGNSLQNLSGSPAFIEEKGNTNFLLCNIFCQYKHFFTNYIQESCKKVWGRKQYLIWVLCDYPHTVLSFKKKKKNQHQYLFSIMLFISTHTAKNQLSVWPLMLYNPALHMPWPIPLHYESKSVSPYILWKSTAERMSTLLEGQEVRKFFLNIPSSQPL